MMQSKSSGDESMTGEKKNLPPFSIPVVWAWKESRFKISTHPKSSIWGDMEGCWIKYNDDCNDTLEKAYRQYASSVERHVAFWPLIELYYEGNEDKVDEAYHCCDFLNKISMDRIENEVRESIERDVNFGIHHQKSSWIVEYFRKKQVDCFVEVIQNCRTVFKLCCERAGVSSEYRTSQLVLRPDKRCATECCLGEDAREMCLHFIDFVKQRLEGYSITDERIPIVTDKLLVFLQRVQAVNSKQLFRIGVSRGDSSRPLRSRCWSQEHVVDELCAKTKQLIESASHDAASF